MRVAIYVRVSTTEQSTELQENELRGFATGKGWNKPEIFRDQATGTNTDRPQFQRLMRLARAGEVDIILVWKLDRAFRSLRDLINHVHELTENDVQFIAMKDNFDLTTPSGKLMCHMIGAFAEFEAGIIKERVRAGIKRAKDAGVRLGRPSTYTKVDYSRVRALYEEGKGPTAIAKDLKIARATVYRILKAA